MTMGFNPRAPMYRLRAKNAKERRNLQHSDRDTLEGPAPDDESRDDRMNQSPMDIAAAGYEVLDRTRRTEPFYPFGPPSTPSKAPAEEANDIGADYRWDRTKIRIGEL